MHSDPAKTISLLDALVASGLTDSAFAVLHHHTPAQTIAEHQKYCADLADEGEHFRTVNNQLIQRRLEMVAAMYRGAGFASGAEAVFIHLAHAALLEVHHDRRPLREQVPQLKA